MSSNDQTYFDALKKKIVAMMQQSYPGINPAIAEWKGQEITNFQEELLKTVNAHISEKWFYTHIKGASQNLPRIDVLNLLSKYAGYSNWDDFKFKNQELFPQPLSETITPLNFKTPAIKSGNRFFILIPVLALVIVCIFYGLFKLFNTREYKFSFYDADTREPIANTKIEVRLLQDAESPVTGFCNADGSYLLKTDKSIVTLVVSATYYETDTIVRILKKMNRDEIVNLHANDYALMIHYFSQSKVTDWEKRRSAIEKIIADDAVIYQVSGKNGLTGAELFSKNEFIDRLSVPTGSLKNLEILDTKFKNEKIIMLRFRIKELTR
ncbi:MAG: hypothetical protein NT004_07805 [Bacteroidetes bacterium]|nr:hypothetical protein [Bacteroidota bacterium]